MKVVIVEDQPIYRDVFRKLCVHRCGLSVVGEAGEVEEGIALVRAHRPDFLLLDIGLPGREGDGLDVAEAAAQVPALRTLVISCHVCE